MKSRLILTFFGNVWLVVVVFGYGSKPETVDKTLRGVQSETIELVEKWSNEIGQKLAELSSTMTRTQQVKESFRHLQNHIVTIEGVTLMEDIAFNIRTFMDDKVEAVRNIAEYAEFLSYHRKNDSAYLNETRDRYFYFDTDGIQNTEENMTKLQDVVEDVLMTECHWMCHQQNLTSLPNNIFTQEKLKELFGKRDPYENGKVSCNCNELLDVLRPNESYFSLPMNYEYHFDEKVNFNVSSVKVATNIFERDMSVLEGIRWSEPLDLVFKENILKDGELIWQYFASPQGFMRHYPAVKWSEERYYQTYDFRTRSWFTEAMTSPKDIIILLDQSGSMKGNKRKLSHQIVNDILDTLNDNDFVNIYTFNNYTLPLVDCFNDTLFQANEENLRLLRENLEVYEIRFVANISLGLEKAFEILGDFRKTNLSANCNQAIMLISEGIDYPYSESLFNESNWQYDFPVRIFTYLLSNEKEDEKQMEFIACSNMGYYVNMTKKPEIREKILQYLKVMSRPINFNYDNKQTPIWSYLYVDLADRRLSNWLWTKVEGIRQREVFLDHVKRRAERLQLQYTSLDHMLLRESHDYEKYEETIKKNYKYMTTVSLPVYGRRDNEYDIIGVAGVDVPIRFFRTRIPHDKIGVNGYAFIITNNGYILMHPEHRTEFEYILKPTFNRVDILETEILDDHNEPRIFGDDIVKLRERMLKRKDKNATLKIKYTLDDMKRIVKATSHYYYTDIGPFTLCIVLPDKYGNVKVNRSDAVSSSHNPHPQSIVNHENWAVHPEWVYCKNCHHSKQTSMDRFVHAYYSPSYRTSLYDDLIHDLNKTSWFDEPIPYDNRFIEPYKVHKIFLSTSSGLTRYKTFNSHFYENLYDEVEMPSNRSIDEDWYQRAVEENSKNEDMFIYSVPFEISGYDKNSSNLIRSTKAIFLERNNRLKTPIAVVGLEFNHQSMYKLYNSITTKSRNKGGRQITCESDYLNCFVLDNNAYIVLSDETEFTGRYIGDIRPDIMHYLIEEKVFEATRMFDYQATCQFEPPEVPNPEENKCFLKKKSAGDKAVPGIKMLFQNILQILQWVLFQLVNLVYSVPSEVIVKEETKIFEKLMVTKTVPTPCDREMWLFTLKDGFRTSFYKEDTTKFDCNWPYVVRKIPKSNLIFLAIFGKCSMSTADVYSHTPEPSQIHYYSNDAKVSLPCYIATKNNYTRKAYMKCYKRDIREDSLNVRDKSFCGHTWDLLN